MTDQPTDQPISQQTKRVLELRARDLKERETKNTYQDKTIKETKKKSYKQV